MATVDRVALKELQRVCDKLALDPIGLTGLWNESVPNKPEEDTFIADIRAFKDAFELVTRLERTRTMLSTLADALQNDIAVLKDSILLASRVHGLAALPDELLRSIFTQLGLAMRDPSNNFQFRKHNPARNLTKVSRRFREVALSTPILWSTFDCYETLQYSKHKRDLCKYHLFHAELHFDIREENEPQYRVPNISENSFTLLASSMTKKDAFSSLHAVISIYDTVEIDDRLQDLHFPALSDLRLYFSGSGPGHFPRWSLPVLKDLRTNTFRIPSSSMESLTTLIIGDEQSPSLYRPRTKYGKVHDLIRILQRSKALMRLEIHLNEEVNTFAGVSYIPPPSQGDLVSLPHLKSLYLSATEPKRGRNGILLPIPFDLLAWLSQCLFTPHLVVAKIQVIGRIDIEIDEPTSVPQFIKSRSPHVFFPEGVVLEEVESLTFAVHTFPFPSIADPPYFEEVSLSRAVDMYLRYLAKTMPHIKELSLIVPGVLRRLDYPTMFRELCTMRLDGWYDSHEGEETKLDFFRSLFQPRNPEYKALEYVSVISHGPDDCVENYYSDEDSKDIVFETDIDGTRIEWKHII